MGRAARIGSPAWIEALKEHCFDHVDRLFADAGITEDMSSEERRAALTAEYDRREKRAAEIEAQASFWRAVQRRWRDE